MRRDVLRRLRWGNIARACALVAVIGVVVAWPRLAPRAPRVPSGAVSPLGVGQEGAIRPRPRVKGRERRQVRRVAGPERRRRPRAMEAARRRETAQARRRRTAQARRRRTARRTRHRPAPRSERRQVRKVVEPEGGGGMGVRRFAPIPSTTGHTRPSEPPRTPQDQPAPPTPQDQPAPPDPDPVVGEFGFETGGR